MASRVPPAPRAQNFLLLADFEHHFPLPSPLFLQNSPPLFSRRTESIDFFLSPSSTYQSISRDNSTTFSRGIGDVSLWSFSSFISLVSFFDFRIVPPPLLDASHRIFFSPGEISSSPFKEPGKPSSSDSCLLGGYDFPSFPVLPRLCFLPPIIEPPLPPPLPFTLYLLPFFWLWGTTRVLFTIFCL